MSNNASITILGSGASTGVPVIGCKCAVCSSTNPKDKRYRTSAVITLPSGDNLLIDTTPDLRTQALSFGVDKISGVLYTHPHSDHIFGFDDLRGFFFSSQNIVPCYGTKDTLDEIKDRFKFAFKDHEDFSQGVPPQVTMNEITYNKPFKVLDYFITPFKLIHGPIEVTGYKLGNLTYATDVNIIPEDSFNIIKGSKHLILGCLHFNPSNKHFTIPEAAEMAGKLGAEETYLIHFSHQVMHDDASKGLPSNVSLAWDGLKIGFSV